MGILSGTQKVLVATGQGPINKAVTQLEGYEVVGEVNLREKLENMTLSLRPDILLVGEALVGETDTSLVTHLLNVKRTSPNVRIVYLALLDPHDEVKIGALSVLISLGVYDIVYNKKLNYQILKEILDEPMNYDDKDIQKILKRSQKKSVLEATDNQIDFQVPEEVIKESFDDGSYENVAVVSSIKPGTGKSFVSSNIAVAIAQYGKPMKNGKKPKVAIIEADLQNLSIGTLLQIEDDKKNIKTAVDKISTIVTDSGNLISDSEKILEVNEFIKSCFLPYKQVNNLYALVGSHLTFEQVENLRGIHYGYLIDAIVDEFDVIIIDSNSSLAHSTTYDLLTRAKNCFYVLNLDFNNVRNNIRYKGILNEIGIGHRVKYVLNEDITNSEGQQEELMFNLDHLVGEGFEFVSRIPLIPKSVFLNRLYAGTPIVLDEKPYTAKAKYELLKVANEVYPIKDLESMNPYVGASEEKKGFFSLFG